MPNVRKKIVNGKRSYSKCLKEKDRMSEVRKQKIVRRRLYGANDRMLGDRKQKFGR